MKNKKKNRVKSFLTSTGMGGLLVILPVAVIVIIYKWVYDLIGGWLAPITEKITRAIGIGEFVAIIIVVATILIVCFIVGLLLKTGFIRFFTEKLESRILKIIPGYSIIRDVFNQFLGRNKISFEKVALAQPFEGGALQTAFVVDEHEDGSYTVFVPTAPNPMGGMVYHLSEERVHIVDVSVSKAMTTVVACGAGSSSLVEALKKRKGESTD